jgi:hypothetical protein
MPNYNWNISEGNRNHVLDMIQTKKSNGKFTVIDIGGSINNWSSKYVDAIADFNTPSGNHDGIHFFNIDITHPSSWIEIQEYVKLQGKFDFSICTHTLEDIMNPGFVIEKLSEISKEGYIAVPSKFRELSSFEGNYRGYIHHRWIFIKSAKGVFKGFPKINYIERDTRFDKIADFSNHKYDLSFFWKDTIDFEYVNNNYLGPSVDAVKNYYDELLE